jgi:signal transduction histidine kinase
MYTTTFTPARAWRAHALKNCLTVIHAVNKLVERDLSDVSRQRMERSHQALRRMVSMLSEDLAQSPDGSSEDALMRVDELVHRVLARVEDVAEVAGVELFVQTGTGSLVGDIASLTEALANVVLNAVQATPTGGAVFIATYEHSDGGQLWVVQDTGCGMPGDVIAQIGTPRCSRRPGGSGFGLASALETFERHSGIVRFESEPGSGTIVSIMLPRPTPRLVSPVPADEDATASATNDANAIEPQESGLPESSEHARELRVVG